MIIHAGGKDAVAPGNAMRDRKQMAHNTEIYGHSSPFPSARTSCRDHIDGKRNRSPNSGRNVGAPSGCPRQSPSPFPTLQPVVPSRNPFLCVRPAHLPLRLTWSLFGIPSLTCVPKPERVDSIGCRERGEALVVVGRVHRRSRSL
jgi:hypothetical protein